MNHCFKEKTSLNSQHLRLKVLNKYFNMNDVVSVKKIPSLKIVSYLVNKGLSCYNNYFIYIETKRFTYRQNALKWLDFIYSETVRNL